MTRSHVDPSWTRNERGAVLIQVAVALLALLALSSFVFDYGVMWVQPRSGAERGRCRSTVGRHIPGV